MLHTALAGRSSRSPAGWAGRWDDDRVGDTELIAVTGATGALGGRVSLRLADRGVTHRLVVRDPERAPRSATGTTIRVAGYQDPDSMRTALAGVDTLLLVSAPEAPDRIDMHQHAVDAAVAAGVRRIVYTSLLAAAPAATFTFARDHWYTERYIEASGVAYTFLRDSLYQDVLPFFVGDDGVLRGPAGDGRFAPVARDDIADVAVAVLCGDPLRPGSPEPGAPGEGHRAHDGRTYDVTGPQALTMTEVAAELASVSGLPITYHAETLDEAYASRHVSGALDWAVTGWVTSFAAIATGEMDVVSDTVARVAGHAPLTFAAYLRDNADGRTRLGMTAITI